MAITDSSVFTKTGLCYLANCYTEDYLQIGVKTTLGGTKWFRCTQEENMCVVSARYCVEHRSSTGVLCVPVVVARVRCV